MPAKTLKLTPERLTALRFAFITRMFDIEDTLRVSLGVNHPDWMTVRDIAEQRQTLIDMNRLLY
jgi:hypothetical protein